MLIQQHYFKYIRDRHYLSLRSAIGRTQAYAMNCNGMVEPGRLVPLNWSGQSIAILHSTTK